eukprot:g180.t1
MTEYPKYSLKQVHTNNGETLYLSVEWLANDVFNIEAINSTSAWRGEHCISPANDEISPAQWLERAYQAFGFEAQPSTEFQYELTDSQESEVKELRWWWTEQGQQHSSYINLLPADFAETTQHMLSVGCNLSSTLTILTKESRTTQVEIEMEMDAVRKEVKEAVRSRRAIYARCATLIKEKNQQLKELLEKQGESVTAVENEDPYSALTKNDPRKQDAN